MIARSLVFASLTLLASAPALAVSGGQIGTLKRGNYLCEWPGDAASEFRQRAPEEDFRITSSSRYENSAGVGTYLLTGNLVQMTSGPMKGTRFEVKNSSYLRRIGADGLPDRLRCIREGSNR